MDVRNDETIDRPGQFDHFSQGPLDQQDLNHPLDGDPLHEQFRGSGADATDGSPVHDVEATPSSHTVQEAEDELPAEVSLWGLFARIGLSDFEHLARLARRAPRSGAELSLAALATSRLPQIEAVNAQVQRWSVTISDAMRPFRRPLNDLHAFTDPHMWTEALTKIVLTQQIWDSFTRSIRLPAALSDYLDRNRPSDEDRQYPIKALRHYLSKDPSLVDRLSLYGRRVVAEVIAQLQHICASNPKMTRYMTDSNSECGDLVSMSKILTDLTADATALMADLGLRY